MRKLLRKPPPEKKSKKRVEMSDALIRGVLKDLQDGTLKSKYDRIRLTDDRQSELHILVYKSGFVTYHAGYRIGGSRPVLKIGDWPDMSLEEARELTKTIRKLADAGYDVQEGLHDRLIRELKEQGTNWRPK